MLEVHDGLFLDANKGADDDLVYQPDCQHGDRGPVTRIPWTRTMHRVAKYLDDYGG